MSLRTSRAASVSPHSIKNLGDSGKKNNQKPIKMLGSAHTATNKFQLPKKKPPFLYLKSKGIIDHAITRKKH